MIKARGTDLREPGGEIRLAAMTYAERGWSVIPIEPRGKRPLVPWLEFQQRLASAAEIDAWFDRWPAANIAIVTGRVSGLVVLDLDPRHGGQASIERLRDEHGPLPRTVEAETGGGGRHLYFAHPGGPRQPRRPPAGHRPARRRRLRRRAAFAACERTTLPVGRRLRAG
jgi:hypothetical protein